MEKIHKITVNENAVQQGFSKNCTKFESNCVTLDASCVASLHTPTYAASTQQRSVHGLAQGHNARRTECVTGHGEVKSIEQHRSAVKKFRDHARFTRTQKMALPKKKKKFPAIFGIKVPTSV